jgi:hypothetical protein
MSWSSRTVAQLIIWSLAAVVPVVLPVAAAVVREDFGKDQ